MLKLNLIKHLLDFNSESDREQCSFWPIKGFMRRFSFKLDKFAIDYSEREKIIIVDYRT